ncbi:formate transporter 1 [Klebsiella pneumoniae]|nr:formate transporter 1 [Klebsiella pneumoniae]
MSLGILANLMVCLAVWMSYSGRSLMDKAMIMVLPVAMFVASGFEHSIANMFMIPMGIVSATLQARNSGPPSVRLRKVSLT